VASKDVAVNVRVKEDSGWTAWETLVMPDDGPDATTTEAARARVGTTPLVSSGATGIQVRVDTATGETPPDLLVSTIDPGTSPADDDLTHAAPAGSASAAATQPAIITRAQWGADEKLRGGITYNSSVKAITIHHTAGTNSYTQADAAAQVRGIYAYDTLGLGWADIAYNFLVDKWGRVYEGRAGSITEAVRGAHAMGFNVDTMGISAMGNYETAAAPAVMVDAMARVAGWKLSQYAVNPLGKVVLTSQGGSGAKFAAGVKATLDTVHAHQNSSYTLCPGKYLYPQMGTIRTQAANYAGYFSTPAPAPAPVPSAQLFTTYGSLTLKSGSTGWAVRDAQLELNQRGFPVGIADGAFGPKTTAGVVTYQKAAQLPVTGVIAANDWKALSGLPYTKVPTVVLTVPAPSVPLPPVKIAGFDADGRGDVMGRTAGGDLYLYPGQLRSFSKPMRIGTGWNMFNTLISPGDFTGDGKADVIGRTPAGKLYLYPGNGKGGFAAGGKVIGTGWNMFNTLVSPGDFTGDGKADVIGRTPAGKLYLYPGNGKGGFAAGGKVIGTGWSMFNTLVSPGDFTGDGKADVIGRTPAGKLYLYPGNGKGGFAAGGKVIGTGWNMFNTLISPGDLTGDRKQDLLGRKPDGRTYLYAGTGKAGYAAGVLIPVAWGSTTRCSGPAEAVQQNRRPEQQGPSEPTGVSYTGLGSRPNQPSRGPQLWIIGGQTSDPPGDHPRVGRPGPHHPHPVQLGQGRQQSSPRTGDGPQRTRTGCQPSHRSPPSSTWPRGKCWRSKPSATSGIDT
jgi:hypothetical protein